MYAFIVAKWVALYLTNHQGAPTLQTDSSGAIYWQADYTPFGNIYALRTPDQHQPLRFPGQEAEEFNIGSPNGASALYYNNARWYNPRYALYTQPDPLGDPFSTYGYARLNPEMFDDPMGLAWQVSAGYGGSVSGGGVGAASFGVVGVNFDGWKTSVFATGEVASGLATGVSESAGWQGGVSNDSGPNPGFSSSAGAYAETDAMGYSVILQRGPEGEWSTEVDHTMGRTGDLVPGSEGLGTSTIVVSYASTTLASPSVGAIGSWLKGLSNGGALGSGSSGGSAGGGGGPLGPGPSDPLNPFPGNPACSMGT